MPYLIKQTITAQNTDGETFMHEPDTVVSDFELTDFIRSQVAKGVDWYRARIEPLTEREAQHRRVKATTLERPHVVDGQVVQPPFEDYVGLHPSEITARMRGLGKAALDQVRAYERSGLNRMTIVDFVGVSEQEPWQGYSDAGVREIFEKLALLDDVTVAEVLVYEMDHLKRPAVLQWERETAESDASEARETAAA